MSTFVLDCSVTLAWLFQDGAGPDTDQLLKELRDDDSNAIVPNLWRLELAMRHGVPLATLDKALIRAARGVAVKTLPA